MFSSATRRLAPAARATARSSAASRLRSAATSSATSRATAGAQPSPQPWVVRAGEPDFEARVASSILQHGFAILPELLSPSVLGSLRKNLLGRTEEVLQTLKDRGVQLEVGSRAGFHEVCLRSPGRYDVPCEFETAPPEVLRCLERIAALTFTGNEQGSGTKSNLTDEGIAKAVSRAFAGVVRAEPGSPPQLWHADSPHQRKEHTTPHILNALVALDDVAHEHGPTEIVPGSQHLTNHFRPGVNFGADELLYQNETNSPELIESTEEPVHATMPAGSVLVFDDRALHRGGHNRSQRMRDVGFYSYCKPGFMPSTHYEGTRSLAKYNHRVMAETVRAEFPSLAGQQESGFADAIGRFPVFADSASGSQVHESVIEAMSKQLKYGTANLGGGYVTSERVLSTVQEARAAASDFLSCSPEEVVFGHSMTALSFHVARALESSNRLGPGDNVVLDPISHGANVWPWVHLAKRRGAEVRWLPVVEPSPEARECLIDARHEALDRVVDSRTRLVTVGAASNGCGSVHNASSVCSMARELSKGAALTFVDAVHFAPHNRVDVGSLGCDLLACSPYKFFGPHSGLLFGRRDLLASLPADKLDCQTNELPHPDNCHMTRFELGTQNFPALAGIAACINYIAGLGSRFGGADAEATRRVRLDAAWRAIAAHETELKLRFLEGVAGVRGVRLLGVVNPARAALRTCTFAVAKEGLTPEQLTAALCERGVWCTSGNHYAGFWDAHSGGLATNVSGLTRISFLHYNTISEVDRVLSALEDA